MHVPAFFCVVFLCGLSAAAEHVAVPGEGEPFQGELVAADSAGPLTFHTSGGPRILAAGQLVRWGRCVDPDRAPVLILRDGSLLAAAILEADDSSVAIDSEALGLVRLPLKQLAGAVFQLPAAALDRDRLLDGAGRSDEALARVVLLNGDEMRGEIGKLDDRGVSLRTGVGTLDLEFGRISTLTFAALPKAADTASDTHTIVGLADGSRVAAGQFAIEKQTATITTTGGLRWKMEAEKVVFLQPSTSQIDYVSDLKPTAYRHVPYLNRSWALQTNRNVQGGLLRCAGQIYLKGIGMHTAARLSYRPPEGARVFQAALGIDDATDGLGSVRFRVFVDGKQKYVSPTVRGGEDPVPISVDVLGAERVDLVIDFADRADVQDHANWLDARFVR